MPKHDYIWDYRPGRNVDHMARHGVTPQEAEQVVDAPIREEPNRNHPDRRFAVGRTATGRKLGVSYVELPAGILVITAFDMR